MEKEELISIIIPVYNVEKYLSKCIESIINQTYQNLEIILVDDGSADNSGKICDEYAEKDDRIIVIHKENGGLSDARNIGIKRAKGKLIGFVDSDDFINENMFAILKEDLIKYEADISICNVQNVNEAGNCLVTLQNSDEESIKVLDKEEALYLLLEDTIKSYAWNKLYKIELFDEIRYPKGKKIEDLATTYKLFDKADKIVCNKQACYNYVYRDNSILHSINSSLINDWNDAINDRYNNLIDKYNQLKDPLIINKLLCIALFFKLFFKLENKDQTLEKVLNKEYIFYRKYYKIYSKRLQKNKNFRIKLELELLYLNKKIFKFYVSLIKLIKR